MQIDSRSIAHLAKGQIVRRKLTRRTMNKKGVSPLIATVLLIAFAVALGAVVMNWGRSYTEQTAAQVKDKSDVDVKCSLDIKIKLLELDDKPKICYAEFGAASYINFTVLNEGTKALEKLNVMLIGADGIINNESVSNTSMTVAAGIKVHVPYAYSATGPLKQIRVSPVAEISGVNRVCTGTGSILTRDIADIAACNATS